VFAITADPIDATSVERALHGPSHGALVTFLGLVRERSHDGKAVTGLSYEAQEPMAVEEFRRIAEEAQDAHPGAALAIVHRVGDLQIGEIAVAVCAAAPHRAAAFAAAHYAIDELKRRAPIWKKEHYLDGASEWISNEC
jgi:molybdopterin synthase catalytic subunit